MRTLVPLSWARDLTRSNANDPFGLLQNEVNRIFDGFGRFGGLQELTAAAPKLDVLETPDAFEVHAELPGIAETDVELTLTGDVLTIKGEKRQSRDEKISDVHVVERSYGAFSRSVRLPFSADPDSAKASFDKGVLTVSIPKPKDRREKSARIPIK
jgi:HSP20 family protein